MDARRVIYRPLPGYQFFPPVPVALQHLSNLPSPRPRPRRRITGRNRIIDIQLDSRIIRLIRSGKANQGPRIPIAPAVDLELPTGNVELGATDPGSAVQSDVLDAEEIFARRERLGECDGYLGFACTICILAAEHQGWIVIRGVDMKGVDEEGNLINQKREDCWFNIP
jgi:hypothetical protein